MIQRSSDQLLTLALQRNGEGKAAEAIRICRRILELDPKDAEALHTLGSLKCARRRWWEALRCFRRAVRLRPREARYRGGTAIALWKLGRPDEAIIETERGLRYAPADVELRLNHARFLCRGGEPKEALKALDRAIAVAPGRGDLNGQAAEILEQGGRFRESEQRWRKLLADRPEEAGAVIGLAGALNRQGRVDEALQQFRRAARMQEVGRTAGQSLLLTLHYSDQETPERIFREHRDWAQGVENGVAARAPMARARRRLRIGYVSGDFRRHAVAHFFEPLIANHDRSAVEVHCFSNVRHGDSLTGRLRSLADGWHEIGSMTDDEAAEAVGKARVDILVDLSGHTAHNRLAVFARKPAPIQVTYLGYPDTTGLRAMDYRFTDSIADPPGATEHLYSEALVRLDPCFLCYRPWCSGLAAGPPPREENGFVTLASLAIREKLSPTILDCWAEILGRAPRTRLLLKCLSMSDPEVRKQIRKFFTTRGIAERRLMLAGSVRSLREHLKWYRRADLILDTYPYNGTTMTCEALWMGVPVVSWCGATHVSRVGASVLTQLSLGELIAYSAEDYIAKTLEAIRSKDRLGQWRRTLRGRMRCSPLMDGERLARAVEAAYREMWRA